jgi:hypothetical protein
MTDWIPYGKTWHEFESEGLNTPGVVVDIGGVGIMLIGDITPGGSECHGCTPRVDSIAGYHDSVIRYRIIYP